MALEPFVPFDLAAAGHPESFRGGSVRFDFWHLFSPVRGS
jgi:hypothetical protein